MSAPPLRPLLQRLVARATQGAKLGLAATRSGLARLGEPHQQLACVHVAGTNGKGSVCAMVEAIARGAGLRTGLYTSPHLCQFNERIRLDGQPIDDDRFAPALQLALDAHRPPLSFFETLTVAAFVALRRAAVDLAIIEVGLGGRLDATNVIDRPLVTAISSIGHDHTSYLGTDLGSIASEKAGIIKPRAPLVLGPVSPESERAILRVAGRVGSGPVWRIRTARPPPQPDVGRRRRPPAIIDMIAEPLGSDQVRLTEPSGLVTHADLGLAGKHQASNAAVAVAAVRLLEKRWPQLRLATEDGLAEAFWPGRLERIPAGQSTVWLDCAHNAAAARALSEVLAPTCDPARTCLLFGAMGDKHWQPMLDVLGPLADCRYYVEPLPDVAGRRPVAPTRLAEYLPGHVVGDVAASLQAALAAARGPVVVTGSIYLVGAVRAALLRLPQDVVVPL